MGPYALVFPWYFSKTGPSLWLAFIVAAVLITPIVFSYGELVAMLPFASGEYAFTRAATSRPIAYSIGWLLSLTYIITLSFMGAGVLRIALLFLDLAEPNRWVFTAIAGAIILAFTLINLLDVKVSFTIQLVACGLLLVVGVATQTLFLTGEHWSSSNVSPFMPFGFGSFLGGVGVIAALYFGFDIVPQLSEESNYAPRRQVWIMFGAVIITAVFYVLAAVANAGMMPVDWLTEQVAADPAIAREFYGNFVLYMVLIAALLAIMTTLNGFILGASRLLFGLGRARVLPPVFAHVNSRDVPDVALWFAFVVSVAVLAIAGENWVGTVTALASGLITAIYAVMCLMALRLRSKHPDWRRPYKVRGGPIVFVIGFFCGVALSYFGLKELSATGWWVLLVYAVMGVVYYLYMEWRARTSPDHREIELTPEDIDAAHSRLELG